MLSTGQRQKVAKLIRMFANDTDQKKTPKRLGGGSTQPRGRGNPTTQMAGFVASTLSSVLTPTQMQGIVAVGDPKFIDPPMTNTQRTVFTEKVLRNVFTPSQLENLATSGRVRMQTLTQPQQNILADLSVGYVTGQVLNKNQFRTFVGGKEATVMSAHQALMLTPFTRTESGQSQPIYNAFKTPASPMYCRMGRYMDRPATELLDTSSSLAGGGALGILKQQITQIPI